MLFDIPIDNFMFQFLSKPGTYTLSAIYSSKSVLTGGEDLGLSRTLLNSLPYTSWSGKISTNEISLTVVPKTRSK